MTRSPIILAILLLAATTAYCDFVGEISGDIIGLVDEVLPSFQTLADYVKTLNYPAETHLITTEDGYILTYFRIQAKNQTTMKSGLPVIYMHHGLLDSADTFVINEEADAPGLQLANQGYDVWFGNSRGNKYCQSHVVLKPTEKAFWQFSWQNMSHYDLPAAFQYIHEITGQKITYIGHSQGTLIMFAALAVREPNVMAYMNKYIALSPVAWVGHQKFGPVVIASLTDFVEEMQKLGINQFMPYEFLTSDAGHIFCKEFPKVCGSFLGMIYGYDPQYDNFDYYNQILEHEPAGTSVMNMLHWKQLYQTQQLSMYDFGTAGNYQHYNQSTPPVYNVSSITFPMHFFHGSDDPLADPTDYQLLVNALTNCNLTKGEYPADHMTFMWSKDISFYWNDLLQALKDPQEDLIQ